MPKDIGIPFGMDRLVANALMEWQKIHGQTSYTTVTGTTADGRNKLMNMPGALFDFLRSKGIDVTDES
ncbi:hypothetical protein [Gluconobacter sp. P5B12]|uniref:hypothetical protein n=1 Tax=unclassified Gluconobacter TaxID=2644261 RepID=UPI001C051BCE|nr:hypothetical protein [Gluconobacter sp. P5B12]